MGGTFWFRRGPTLGSRLKRGVRTSLRLAKRPWTLAQARASYWRGRARANVDLVRQRVEGHRPLGTGSERVAVFVSYDGESVVQDYVLHYLEQLGASGFEVVFVSNSPAVAAADMERLRERCGLILHRQNVGYDFGAYKDGIAATAGLPSLRELLICNDSVYGPITPLAPALARIDWERADIWGMTDSWDKAFHLQSYFVLFGARALASAAFRTFWDTLPYVQSKTWVSQRYEVGLSRALMAGGLRCAALFPYRDVSRAVLKRASDAEEARLEPETYLDQHRLVLGDLVNRHVALNATHVFWRPLIEVFGYPFLKRELVQVNPLGLPGVVFWEDVVRGAGSYNPDLITRHLEQRQRHRAP